MSRNFSIRALGEVAIRCTNMEAMVSFYEDMLGLERMSGNANDGIVFFRIAEGFAGHTSVLALFDKTFVNAARPGLHPDGAPQVETGGGSSLHHLALSLPFAEQEAVMEWYEQHDQAYRVEHFGWVGWRGIFTEDPDGNTVELVAYDPSLKT